MSNDGTYTVDSQPVKVTNGTRFVSVSCGYYHSLAIDEYGNIWAWGDNEFGKLGDGTMRNSDRPMQITNKNKFVYVVAMGYFSMALDENGDLYCCGLNVSGVFANGISDWGYGLSPTIITLE